MPNKFQTQLKIPKTILETSRLSDILETHPAEFPLVKGIPGMKNIYFVRTCMLMTDVYPYFQTSKYSIVDAHGN